MITFEKPRIWDGSDYVYPGDPALDTEQADWETELEAALESRDLERLPLKPNQEVTVFRLRAPDDELKRIVQGYGEHVGRHAIGSAIGFRRIAELMLVSMRNANGSVFGKEHEFDTVTSPEHGYKVVRAGEMEKLAAVDGGGLIDGIGMFAMLHLNPSKN
jgi:hypothetical protein